MRVYAMLVRDAEINTKRKGGFTPLHDPRLATPLRKEEWLNRVCSSPCQKVP